MWRNLNWKPGSCKGRLLHPIGMNPGVLRRPGHCRQEQAASMREQGTDVEVSRDRLRQLLLSFRTGLVILAGNLLGSRKTWSARHFSH